MGFEVEIIRAAKGDTQNTHAAWTKYNLAARTRWLQDEPGKWRNCHRASQTLRRYLIVKYPQALNLKRYGAESRNLILFAPFVVRSHRFMPMCLSLILALLG